MSAPLLKTKAGFGEYIDDRASAVVQTALDLQKNITLNQFEPPASGGVASTSGVAGVISGNTYYQVTFVTADGETELSPFSTITNPTLQTVFLTSIPTGPAGVIARKLYRTNVAQGEQARYLATINDNTTTTYTDNTPAASLTELPYNVNTTGGIVYLNDVPVIVADKAATILGNGSGLTNATEFNTFIGNQVAPAQTIGYWNTGVGYMTLNGITSGYENTALGVYALEKITTGKYNTAVGVNAGRSLTTASDNCYFGYAAGDDSTGSNNCLFGTYAAHTIVDCSNVSAFGVRAGSFLEDGVSPVTIAAASTFIGADAKSGANGSSYEIVVGAGAVGLGSNTVVIGKQDNLLTRLHGVLQVRKPATDALTEALRILPDGAAASQGNFFAVNFMGQGVGSNVVDFCSRISSGFDADAARMTIGTNVGGVMQSTLTLKNNRVGIATVNPAYALEVTGNTRFSGSMLLAGDKFIVETSGRLTLEYDLWHRSREGQDRLLFLATGASYYKTATTHIFRNSSDADIATIGSTGKLSVTASDSARATFRIPHGTAPTSPQDGDIWTTTAGLFVRINGSTIGPLS